MLNSPSSGKSQDTKVVIISKIPSPEKALNTGMLIAKKEIEYKLESLGGNKWNVILTRGKIEDLFQIIKSTRSIEIVPDSVPPDSIDVDLDF